MKIDVPEAEVVEPVKPRHKNAPKNPKPPPKDGSHINRVPDGHMTSKQAGAILNRAAGMKLADAAIAAGYECVSRNSAQHRTENAIKRHMNPNSQFMDILKTKFVSMETVADKLAELLNAKTYVRTGRDDSMEVPDNRTQLQTCELLTKVMNLEPPKKVEIEGHLTFEQRIMQLTQVEVRHVDPEE